MTPPARGSRPSLSLGISQEVYDLHPQALTLDEHPPQGDRKVGPAGARAPGIHVQHSAPALDSGGVGVAVNHGPEPGRGRVQVEVVQDVEEVDVHAIGGADYFGLIQQPPELAVVGVAANRSDWGDPFQGGKNRGIADVPCVKNERAPRECC